METATTAGKGQWEPQERESGFLIGPLWLTEKVSEWHPGGGTHSPQRALMRMRKRSSPATGGRKGELQRCLRLDDAACGEL